MKLYIGNLSFDLTESKLQGIFSAYGEVNSVTIIHDKRSGRSKGFGFIEMNNDEEALEAIKRLNGYELNNRPLTVNKAHPTKPRD